MLPAPCWALSAVHLLAIVGDELCTQIQVTTRERNAERTPVGREVVITNLGNRHVGAQGG